MKGFVGIIIPYEDIHELVVEEEFIQFVTHTKPYNFQEALQDQGGSCCVARNGFYPKESNLEACRLVTRKETNHGMQDLQGEAQP